MGQRSGTKYSLAGARALSPPPVAGSATGADTSMHCAGAPGSAVGPGCYSLQKARNTVDLYSIPDARKQLADGR